MPLSFSTLAELGWTTFFSTQADTPGLDPVRVMAVHRGRIHVVGVGIDALIPPFLDETVGDWLLVARAGLRPARRLERMSLFQRRAAGTARALQSIAANIDTLFVVSSCNQDFNLARIERYLALAKESGAVPVVVLTKADLAAAPLEFARACARLLPGLAVEALDARDRDGARVLAPWCAAGRTVALVGSSGVGKTTLVNTLTGGAAATQAVRAGDDKGLHTTTARSFYRLSAGGWLLDTPGMREIQLAGAQGGINDVFAEVTALSAACRFTDCAHESEPGCAVKAALADGALDEARLKRWRKLTAENARNDASLSERRAADRAFGRMAKRVLEGKRKRREERD